MARRLGSGNVVDAERMEIRRRVAAGERADLIAASLGRERRTVFKVLSEAWRARATADRPLAAPAVGRRARGDQPGCAPASRSAPSRAASGGALDRVARGAREPRPAWLPGLAGRARPGPPRAAAADGQARPRPAAPAERGGAPALRWSPQQIARRLRHDHPDEPEMWVSHETIYQSLFVQGRGALRRADPLPADRPGPAAAAGRARAGGPIRGMVLISERPAEVEDRAVPGHWEGDLLIGQANRSAIGTLVERRTRFVMLVALPDGQSAEHVRTRLAEQILTLPEQLRRSLYTGPRAGRWPTTRGSPLDTGVAVYVLRSQQPWQRGSNENTNGLLRQYFPKGHRPQGLRSGAPRCRRRGAQRPASTDPRLDETMRGPRRRVAMRGLSPPTTPVRG